MLNLCGETYAMSDISCWQWPCVCCCPCCVGNPCSDGRQREYRWTFWSFIGILVILEYIMYIVELSFGFYWYSSDFMQPFSSTLLLLGGNYWPYMRAPYYQLWRLLTACFLHNGMFHILFNTLAQAFYVRRLEADWGKWKTVFIYLIAGIGGNLVSASRKRANVVSVGASGAILGIAGAHLIYLGIQWRNPVSRSQYNKMQLFQVILLLVLCFFWGGGGSFSVDFWAHLGGFSFGVMLALAVFGRDLDWPTPVFRKVWPAVGALSGVAVFSTLLMYMVWDFDF